MSTASVTTKCHYKIQTYCTCKYCEFFGHMKSNNQRNIVAFIKRCSIPASPTDRSIHITIWGHVMEDLVEYLLENDHILYQEHIAKLYDDFCVLPRNTIHEHYFVLFVCLCKRMSHRDARKDFCATLISKLSSIIDTWERRDHWRKLLLKHCQQECQYALRDNHRQCISKYLMNAPRNTHTSNNYIDFLRDIFPVQKWPTDAFEEIIEEDRADLFVDLHEITTDKNLMLSLMDRVARCTPSMILGWLYMKYVNPDLPPVSRFCDSVMAIVESAANTSKFPLSADFFLVATSDKNRELYLDDTHGRKFCKFFRKWFEFQCSSRPSPNPAVTRNAFYYSFCQMSVSQCGDHPLVVGFLKYMRQQLNVSLPPAKNQHLYEKIQCIYVSE